MEIAASFGIDVVFGNELPQLARGQVCGACNRLARAFIATGHRDQATPLLAEVLKLDPRNPDALSTLEKAQRMAPDVKGVNEHLAAVRAAVGQQRS